jgi:hypothetical protein
LEGDKKYYWRVGTYDRCFEYLWSPVWSFRTAMTNSVTEEIRIPEKFSISQNYPNPFNPGTNFELQIAKSGMVTLEVFDLLGRNVSTIVNEELLPGVQTFKWDASGFAGGLYILRMTAGSFSESRKLILMK